MKIISIGDLVTDFYYKDGKLVGVNGGMTSHNIIVNISKMKFETAVYGVCGTDAIGKIAIDSLKAIGVNVDNIKIIDDEQDTEIMYFYGQEFYKTKLDINQYIEKIQSVTKQDVLNIAQNIKIDTIYFLNDKK